MFLSPLISEDHEIDTLVSLLKKEKIIGIDTEFIRESTFFPQLETIQIGTQDSTWMIDVQAFIKKEKKNQPEGLKPLCSILINKNILKVFHAPFADQECLLHYLGVLASPVFDTSTAAGLCGLGDGLGLSALVSQVLGVFLKKGHTRSQWSIRPLPPELIEYAQLDVAYLVPLADALIKKLESLSRKQWAFHLSQNFEKKEIYETNEKKMTLRLIRNKKWDFDSISVLYSLVCWREKKVKEVNIPRRWFIEDSILINIAKTKPHHLEKLSLFRGLSQTIIKKYGFEIIEILSRPSLLEKEDFFSDQIEEPSLEGDEGSILNILKCYIDILANSLSISSRYLIEDIYFLLPVLRGACSSLQDLISFGILTSHAAELIGKELLDMCQGKIKISLYYQMIRIEKERDQYE